MFSQHLASLKRCCSQSAFASPLVKCFVQCLRPGWLAAGRQGVTSWMLICQPLASQASWSGLAPMQVSFSACQVVPREQRCKHPLNA